MSIQSDLGASRATILIVDDQSENIDLLNSILNSRFNVKAATNAQRALEICRRPSSPDMVLLDVMMPGMNGYEVCRILKDDPKTKSIPIIFVTSKDSTMDESFGLQLGAVDYISKPIHPAVVLARVSTQLALSDQSRHLEALVDERTSELKATRLELISCLGKAAEFKDNETGLHVIRMSHYSRILAEKISNDASWCNLIYLASPMHDIGKIGIPDAVLLKPGKLDKHEWLTMKKHPEYGAKILGEQSSPLLTLAREIAISHHERWDGTGYPNGLNEEKIPLSGRVVAIADVFDALTSQRPYKEPWSFEQATQHILDGTGSHFDPSLCEIFKDCLAEFEAIYLRYGEQ